MKYRNKTGVAVSALMALLLLVVCADVFSQSRKKDSLEKMLAGELPDSTRGKALLELFNEIRFSDPIRALSLAKEAKTLALAGTSKRRQAAAFSKLGLIYGDLGNLDLALDYDLRFLRIYEELKDTLQIAGAQLNIAIVYKKQMVNDKAREWLGKSLANFKLAKSKIGQAYVYNNLAIICRSERKYQEALGYHIESIKIKEEQKDSSSLGNSYMNIGLAYEDMGNDEKALEYYHRGLDMFKAINNIKGFAGVYNNIGEMLIRKGLLQDGVDMLKRSLEYSTRVHSPEDEIQAHKNLAIGYEKMGKYEDALKEQDLYRAHKDSALNEENARQIALLEASYEMDKKDNEIAGLEKDAEIRSNERKMDRIIIGASIIGLILVLALGLLLVNQYRFRARTAETLADTNSRINVRRKEITDSISYARKIQESILPRFDKFNEIIPESFLLHKPREIVSGDFYWLHRDGDLVYAAVADNLLHGVPGAFISMVGVNILNAAVEDERITDLQKLLAHMEKGVGEMLSENSREARRLNLSIAKLDMRTGELEFASTDNPLFMVNSKGVTQVDAVKEGDMVTRLRLKKGDTIYMFTDGYVDQMGGGEGKKMLNRKVGEILFRNWPIPMTKQKEGLLGEFESWRGNYEQVDDVLVMGIRF